MTRLAMQLMIGDKEFRAIGHVAAQWAYLETQFDFLVQVLLHQPVIKELGLKPAQSFQRRAEHVRKAAKIVLADHPEALNSLLKIVHNASSLRGFRDDIIHGHWKPHRALGRLMWGELRRGFDHASQGLDQIGAISGKEIPDEARRTYTFVPAGLESRGT